MFFYPKQPKATAQQGQQQKPWEDLEPLQMLTQLIRTIPVKQIASILKTENVFPQIIMEAPASFLKQMAKKKEIQQDNIFRSENIKHQDKINVLDLPLKDLMYHCGNLNLINYKLFLKGKQHYYLNQHSHFGNLLVKLKPNQFRIGKKVKLAHLKFSRIIYKQYFPGRPFNYDSSQDEQYQQQQAENVDQNGKSEKQGKQKKQSDSQSDDSFIQSDGIVEYEDDFSSDRQYDCEQEQDRPKKKLGGGKKQTKDRKKKAINLESSEQPEIEISQQQEERYNPRYITRRSKQNQMLQQFDWQEQGISTKRRKQQ